MKFGVSTWLWVEPFTNDDVDLLRKIADIGFDAVEIGLEVDHQFDLPCVAPVVRDLGLSCSLTAVMTDTRDPIHPDPQVQQNGLRYLRECVDSLAALGGGPIAGASYTAAGRVYRATPEQKKREFDLCVKHMREAAEYAGDHGVVIAMEPLNRFESSFMSKTWEGLAVVEAVEHPALGINLDAFHINIEEKHFGAIIESVGKRLFHFHACENDRGTPGTGHVPWLEVATALKKIGYDRTLVIESFTAQREPIATAAAVWHPLAPDMDQMAVEGLAFLKGLFNSKFRDGAG
jgi:D-psicose/D-tagatose/L-ribulose 3-epimerase